jgi:hypothetical protein
MERDPGGHVQQRADRRLAVFGAGDIGHVGSGRFIERADFPVFDRDAEQHRRDDLSHRMADKAIAVGTGVTVMLEQNFLARGDQ